MRDADITLYVDGSASIGPWGERLSGYTIVDQKVEIIEAAAFDSPYSAQQAELFALIGLVLLGEI